MAADGRDGSGGAARETAAARLGRARYGLAATALALLLASALWAVPLPFALAAFFGIALATALLPAEPARAGRPAGGALSPGPRDSPAEAVLAALPQPAILLDAAGACAFLNARALAAFPGLKEGDPLSLTLRAPQLVQALGEAASGRAATITVRQRSDPERVYSVAVSPVALAAAGPAATLVILDDITERLAVARMRTDFIANASHELRTPLTSLIGFIETMLGPARGDAAAAERFLGIMLEQAERMRRLLDDLLSLSRLEMRAHRVPTDAVDCAAVLRHVAAALSPLAREQGVEIAVAAPYAPLLARGDRDELVEVVENLVENGLKYGAGGGRVEVALTSAARAGREVARIEVRDFGPGIAPEHLPRITERFYRVDVDSSRARRGTGLGLAIVKHIVAHHEGRLDVWSRLGEGARFTVELPLWRGEAADKAEAQTAEAIG